jgi:hypothetical protein
VASSTAPVVAAATKPKQKEAPAPPKIDDDFWDDALGSSEPVKAAVASPQTPAGTGPSPSVVTKQFGSTSSYSSSSKSDDPPKKKKK